MDNVLVDFSTGITAQDEATLKEYEGHLDDIPGIFSQMKPMEGAIEAVHALSEKFDLYILSTAPWKNPSAWADKVAWVTRYLDDVLHKKLIISHHKDLCKGDYLIDDRTKNGAGEFSGELIQFGTQRFPDWNAVVAYLMGKAEENGIGRYFRHFKGGLYKLLHVATDSETLEKRVVYQALYGDRAIWVRPYEMFFESIERDGQTIPRFKEISKDEAESALKLEQVKEL